MRAVIPAEDAGPEARSYAGPMTQHAAPEHPASSPSAAQHLASDRVASNAAPGKGAFAASALLALVEAAAIVVVGVAASLVLDLVTAHPFSTDTLQAAFFAGLLPALVWLVLALPLGMLAPMRHPAARTGLLLLLILVVLAIGWTVGTSMEGPAGLGPVLLSVFAAVGLLVGGGIGIPVAWAIARSRRRQG